MAGRRQKSERAREKTPSYSKIKAADEQPTLSRASHPPEHRAMSFDPEQWIKSRNQESMRRDSLDRGKRETEERVVGGYRVSPCIHRRQHRQLAHSWIPPRLLQLIGAFWDTELWLCPYPPSVRCTLGHNAPICAARTRKRAGSAERIRGYDISQPPNSGNDPFTPPYLCPAPYSPPSAFPYPFRIAFRCRSCRPQTLGYPENACLAGQVGSAVAYSIL
jgi:hypothetical protein